MNEREGEVVRKRAAGNHEISLGRDTRQGSIYEAAAKASQVFEIQSEDLPSLFIWRDGKRVSEAKVQN